MVGGVCPRRFVGDDIIVLCCVTRCVRPWKVSEQRFVQFGADADWCRMRWVRPRRGSKNLFCKSLLFKSKNLDCMSMRWVGPARGSKNLCCISFYLQRGKCGRGGQTGRPTDKHIHTHTRARAPTRHTHVTKHIRRCCGHTKMRSVDLVNNSLLGSRPLWLSDSITDSGCGRSQPPFRGGGVGGNG